MEMLKWIEKSKEEQTKLAVILGKGLWSKFNANERVQLEQKIRFTLYGVEKDDGLTSAAKEKLEEITRKCIEYSKETYKDGSVYIAVLYTYVYKMKDKVDVALPVLRIRYKEVKSTKVTNSYFIDHLGRVYNTWQHYLNKNVWDNCMICVPKNGIYLNKLNWTDALDDTVEFKNQIDRGEVLRTFDQITKFIIGQGSTFGLIAGLGLTLFPPTAPIGGAILLGSRIASTSVLVYGSGRSITTLMDKYKHKQSINFMDDPQARQCWLILATSCVAACGFGVEKYLKHAGETGAHVSKAARMFCTSVSVAKVSTTGLTILDHVAVIKKKGFANITFTESFQFSLNIVLFIGSIINFKTADTILENIQEEFIKKFRAGVDEKNLKNFDSLTEKLKDTVKHEDKIYQNAEFIKASLNGKVDEMMKVLEAPKSWWHYFKFKFLRRGEVKDQICLEIIQENFPSIMKMLNPYELFKFFKALTTSTVGSEAITSILKDGRESDSRYVRFFFVVLSTVNLFLKHLLSEGKPELQQEPINYMSNFEHEIEVIKVVIGQLLTSDFQEKLGVSMEYPQHNIPAKENVHTNTEAYF